MDMGLLFDKLSGVLLYTLVAIIGGALLVAVAVYFLKRERLNDVMKYAVGILIGFAIAMVVAMSYIKSFDSEFDDAGKKMLFWPIMAEIIVVLAGLLVTLICGLFSKKAAKITGIVTAVGALGGFIAIMVQMSKYFKLVQGDYDANNAGLIVSAIVFMAVIVIAYFFGDKRELNNTKAIVYGAIAIALSFALSYVKLFELPQGGSVTFASLLPLMLYCNMFGTRRGLIVCLIYGTLQAVQDTYIIHPMQFLLDYPLAFGLIGVSGIFAEKGLFKKHPVVSFVLGGVLGVALRFACHVCSGVFAFSVWADLDTYGSVAAYSLAYNSFAFIDMLIALVAGVIMYGSRAFLAQLNRSSDSGSAPTTAEESALDDEPFEADIYTRNDDETDV